MVKLQILFYLSIWIKKGVLAFKWEILPNFPGPGRVQLVVVAQNEAEERHLFIFGGSSYPENQELPTICTDGLEYKPKTKEWNSSACHTS